MSERAGGRVGAGRCKDRQGRQAEAATATVRLSAAFVRFRYDRIIR